MAMASAGDAERVCGWGRWQARLALLLALPEFDATTSNKLGHSAERHWYFSCEVARCEVPECEGNDTTYSAARSEGWGARALPAATPCARWVPRDAACAAGSFDNATRQPCDRFVYESRSSIVAEFDLGCQEMRRSLVGTAHNVGMLVSLPIMGHVSDRYGRRAALLLSGVGAGLLGLAKSFAGSYHAVIYGLMVIPVIEWLGVEHRILTSLVLGIPLAAGAATLSLLDYLLGSWRSWCRVAYPPSLLLLLYPWLLPESVRWLAIRGRGADALRLLKQAARWNRVDASDEAFEKMLSNQDEKGAAVRVQDESLFAAFIKYGALRRRLVVCFVWWVSAVFVFYGLAVRAHALGGSAHATYALLAAAELPALLANTLLLDRAGRRPLLTAAFLLTAVSLVAIPCLPGQYKASSLIIIIIISLQQSTAGHRPWRGTTVVFSPSEHPSTASDPLPWSPFEDSSAPPFTGPEADIPAYTPVTSVPLLIYAAHRRPPSKRCLARRLCPLHQ
ncbi:hypothetical protein MSG28_009932 [Choristoneura fumiferana]|uniref:Uncharacterized protein n=1 Tax=Choristoneura fumiferana TaxID=7141 RepID=A0ACC0JD41_CHOFU|nr:hypothetical protein MSG28_009932 [Choristoneura fumiferana]